MNVKRELSSANFSDLVRTFSVYDENHSGRLRTTNLAQALEKLGCKASRDEVACAIKAAELKPDVEYLTLYDFKRVYQELCKHDPRLTTIESTATKSNLYQYGACGDYSDEDTLHSVSEEEQIAFSSWMERNLRDDPSCSCYFPFEKDGTDLYGKCQDGVLLCKIINCSSPGTIDERALNVSKRLTTFQMHENITLALNSARAIGCNVVNIGAGDILRGTKHLLLGLLWQIIKIGLLKQINVVAHAELATLLEGDETILEFAKLSPEDILIRWVNFHLKDTGSEKRMKNFTMDIQNCEVYAYLMEKIAPQEKKKFMHSTRAILDAVDLVQRAEMVLQNAEILDSRVFVRPQDIVSGSQRLNLAFLANLFHGYPALDKPPDVEEKVAEVEETREERTYRNWINSMGVEPGVNNLFSDLTDGLALLKLYDIIKAHTVDWSTVHTEICPVEAKANFQKLENCALVIGLGKQSGFSLVGVGGADIQEGKKTMTLALLWQLMRAYTLSVLTKLTKSQASKNAKEITENQTDLRPITEAEIITWANRKLEQTGKQSSISLLHGFGDPGLASGRTLIDLIDAIRPGSVDYGVVLPGKGKQEQLANARYAIPLARRIGACVYAVPEDLVEMKSKMIMTIFACLMSVDIENKQSRAMVDGVQTRELSECMWNQHDHSQPQHQTAQELEEKITRSAHDPVKSSRRNEAICYEIPEEQEDAEVPKIRRPPLLQIPHQSTEKHYIKTFNFTLSRSRIDQSPRKEPALRPGPAGDFENKSEFVRESERFEKHATQRKHSSRCPPEVKRRPRFLSPTGLSYVSTTTGPAHCSTQTVVSNDEKFSGNSGWKYSSRLSQSTSALDFTPDELTEQVSDLDLGLNERNQQHSQMSACSVQNNRDIDHQKRNVLFDTELRAKMGAQETTWSKTYDFDPKTNSYKVKDDIPRHYHGGGRLFFAAKYRR
ncbi:unnamed protein product [Calicophoron daubneyi]|uniref:Plastin-3 n=1 Tax=Calicophoron daubneyi TaxID=300641 RepID=A0AAV2TJI2_CALDB